MATYGLLNATFRNITCRAPLIADAVPQPNTLQTFIDNSMFTFYTSFGAS